MAYKKCLLCGEPILPTEQFVPYKGRSVHQHCFNATIKQIGQEKKSVLNVKAEEKAKNKKNTSIKSLEKIKGDLSEEEYAKKKQYYDYLESLLKDKQLTVKQFALSERLIEKYKFTFEGMYQTLVYLNEILEKDLIGDIVGIIPYYYNEAESFNEELEQIEKNNKKIDLRKLYPEKIIYIKPQKRKIKQLDMEGIGE